MRRIRRKLGWAWLDERSNPLEETVETAHAGMCNAVLGQGKTSQDKINPFPASQMRNKRPLGPSSMALLVNPCRGRCKLSCLWSLHALSGINHTIFRPGPQHALDSGTDVISLFIYILYYLVLSCLVWSV